MKVAEVGWPDVGVAQLLVQRAAERVRERAVHLAVEQRRVQDGAGVVHDRDALDRDLEGVRIDPTTTSSATNP